MAYALVSKTNGLRALWVQLPPPAFIIYKGVEADLSAIGPSEGGRLRRRTERTGEKNSHLRQENLQTSLKGALAPIAFGWRFCSAKSNASASLLPLGGFLEYKNWGVEAANKTRRTKELAGERR
jgi:hypothetical protein